MRLESVELSGVLDLKVAKLFAKWIHRLRLSDWDVRWRVARKSELPENQSVVCEVLALKKQAIIKVLHPDDAAAWIDPYDVELTVVHELLHLHFAPWELLFEPPDQANLFLEQTVHTLSKTFLEADRADRRWSNFPELSSVQDSGCMVR